jgi:hypothetical protein
MVQHLNPKFHMDKNTNDVMDSCVSKQKATD